MTERSITDRAESYRLFWCLAHWAMRQRLVSADTIRAIVRPGTRKQGYWARHVRDLCAVIAGDDVDVTESEG